MNRQHPVESYWQDENDWLCTVEFLPSDDREGRLFAADLVGYLCGYAQLTNARVLASSVILRRARTISFFPFRLLKRKRVPLSLVRQMGHGNDYIREFTAHC
jgi:hypothetical protein